MTNTLLTQESQVPAQPSITYTGPAEYPSDGLTFTCSDYASSANSDFAAMEWRVAEVHNPAVANYDPLQPNIYEIENGFESGELTTFEAAYQFPPISVKVGKTYRARVRFKDAAGRWSHWSRSLQFTPTAPNISDHLRDLRISEFMYHPPEPTGDEALLSTNRDEFEFVELKNVGPTALDLRDVRFTKGIDFDFAGSAVETLGPGEFVLVVKNRAAFEARYGVGLPVAGEYPNDNLRNSGERLKLSFGAGTTIRDIDEYSDKLPWPTAADGDYSLVLIGVDRPLSPDHNDPANWRISRYVGGSPGKDDSVSYVSWKLGYSVTEDLSDEDRDGAVTVMEYFLGGDPTTPSADLLPVAGVEAFTVDGAEDFYLTISFPREVAADGVSYYVEFSSDLVTWITDGVLVRQEPSGRNDGIVRETWRAAQALSGGEQFFARLRVEN